METDVVGNIAMPGAIDTYRRVPGWAVWIVAGILSGSAALAAGIAAGIAAMYLYDRGMSKGDDLAVFLIAFLALGTFVFVVAIAWLLKKHHDISGRVPLVAMLFPFALAVIPTLMAYESNYSGFALVGWVVILLCALAANAVCERYFVSDEQPVGTKANG